MNVRRKPESWAWMLWLPLWLWTATSWSGLLQKAESRDLFIWSWDFISSRLLQPGGLLSLTGSFLTQFLHIPVLGALLLTALYALLARMVRRLYFKEGRNSMFSLFPSAFLACAAMATGYMVYRLKLAAFLFVPPLGLTVAVLAPTLATHFRNRPAFILIWTATAYSLAGFYGLLGTLLVIIKSDSHRLADTAAALAAVAAVPLVWAQFYTATRTDNAFLAMLPLFSPEKRYFACALPYLLAILSLLFMPLAARLPQFRCNAAILTAIAALTVFCPSIGKRQFRTELKMSAAVDEQDWEKVLTLGDRSLAIAARDVAHGRRRICEPTRLMVLYRDLALLELGREGTEAFNYRRTGIKPETAVPVSMAVQAARQMYFHFGLPAYSYRWCFETSAQSGLSYENLVYLSASCILGGNEKGADRYLTRLEHTLFYRKWALQQRSAGGDGYGFAKAMLCTEDWLDNDYSQLEAFLSSYFTQYETSCSSPEFFRTALLWSAQTRLTERFFNAYDNYVSNCGPDGLDSHWQQALQLFAGITQGADISRIPLDKEQKQLFISFRKFMRDNPEPSEKQLQKWFGNTFYSYFQSGQMPPMY